jgi:hypothetical protein
VTTSARNAVPPMQDTDFDSIKKEKRSTLSGAWENRRKKRLRTPRRQDQGMVIARRQQYATEKRKITKDDKEERGRERERQKRSL